MNWGQPIVEVAAGFGLSLAVGLLVGIERERHYRAEDRRSFAGIRTFPLFALAGALSGFLTRQWGPFLLLPAFIVVGALVAINYWFERRKPANEQDPGLTTEMAALLVFGIGALPLVPAPGLPFTDRAILTAALGTVVMALLSLKAPMHKLAEKVERRDMYATVRFLLLAVVILPLLPDQTFGRWDALNPFWIGVVIVLIAGISFVGYIAVRLFGARKGMGLTGFFGGLVSSTAVTLTFSRRARETPELTLLCAFAIVLASVVMFPRVIVEVAAINAPLTRAAAWPMGAALLAGLIGAGVMWKLAVNGAEDGDTPEFENPFQLKQALKLGLLYAAVRLLTAAAHDWLGDQGLYASAVLAGLTDVDAITISVSRMQKVQEGVSEFSAVLAISIAAASNTVTKVGIAFFIGGKRLGLIVAAALLPAAAAGVVVALLM